MLGSLPIDIVAVFVGVVAVAVVIAVCLTAFAADGPVFVLVVIMSVASEVVSVVGGPDVDHTLIACTDEVEIMDIGSITVAEV